jgi:uncharacterized phage infection (PIP) family protein YhgE
VHLTTGAEITFAASAVIACWSLAAAIVGRARDRALIASGLLLGLAAVALWVAFAFDGRTRIAVAALGTTVSALIELAALRIRNLAEQTRAVDDHVAAAQGRIAELVKREAAERSAELDRTLARARADSASLLAEQERRLAEERRRTSAEREGEAASSLAAGLAAAQSQVETRLRAWHEDLDRMQHAVTAQLAQLAQRQRQLIAEAEARIAADAERLETETEQQRGGLVRLRDELARAIQETIASGNSELETYAAERRRALHELNERIRKRERSLAEQVAREEAEATRRIQTAFADVERRQVEQLQRMLDRATSSYSDAAAQQFTDAIRAAREDAATRLSRELDRAVQAFAREAERLLADRLARVGDAGAQRLEKRLNQVTAGLERQRGEAIGAFEERLISAEQELRRRLETLAADAEAERAVLEARLHELARRIEEAVSRP